MSRRERADEPSDFVENCRDLDAMRRKRHQEWFDTNMRILQAAPFRFMMTANGTCLLFREVGKPNVDFYPHTGRWKAGATMHRGGAAQFVKWYQKQRANR
jgi:hypothetical protein